MYLWFVHANHSNYRGNSTKRFTICLFLGSYINFGFNLDSFLDWRSTRKLSGHWTLKRRLPYSTTKGNLRRTGRIAFTRVSKYTTCYYQLHLGGQVVGLHSHMVKAGLIKQVWKIIRKHQANFDANTVCSCCLWNAI